MSLLIIGDAFRLPASVLRVYFEARFWNSERWIKRLEAWDPENAYVHLLAAGVAKNSEARIRGSTYAPFTAGLRRALFADLRWRASMEKAFSAKRSDAYAREEYALDRQVLLENGLDRPDMLLSAYEALPILNSGFSPRPTEFIGLWFLFWIRSRHDANQSAAE